MRESVRRSGSNYFTFISLRDFASASCTTCDETLKQAETEAATTAVSWPLLVETKTQWRLFICLVVVFFSPHSENPCDVAATQTQPAPLFIVRHVLTWQDFKFASLRKSTTTQKQNRTLNRGVQHSSLRSGLFICSLLYSAVTHV